MAVLKKHSYNLDYLKLRFDDGSHPKTEYPKELVEYLCGRFLIPRGGGASVLEIGCGRGDFINAFCNRGLSCYAVDISERHSDLNKEIQFYQANIDGGDLPFADNAFDVVFTKSVIEHIMDTEHFISECKRVLKKGGKVIVMTPEWKSSIYLFYRDYTHIKPFDSESLKYLLMKYNFINVSSEAFYQLPILWKFPILKIVSYFLQLFGPPKTIMKNKFIRWSRELMVLAYGQK
jgi:SAM-dependent methyltransferase